jgi:hypothetical protein
MSVSSRFPPGTPPIASHRVSATGSAQRARSSPASTGQAFATQRGGARRIRTTLTGAQHPCVKPFTATYRPIEKFIDEGTTPGIDGLKHVLRECQQHYWEARGQDASRAAPWVCEQDFALIGKLVDSMLSPQNSQDFNALPRNMQDAVRKLHALRNTPGQPRYTAWSTLCTLLKTPPTTVPHGAQPLAHQPVSATRPRVPLQRQVSAPAAVSQRKPVTVQAPAKLQEFHRLLDRLGRRQVMMESDMRALADLCHAERVHGDVWGKKATFLMWKVGLALQNRDSDSLDLMHELRASLDRNFPPA